jgi:hypothetical protein
MFEHVVHTLSALTAHADDRYCPVMHAAEQDEHTVRPCELAYVDPPAQDLHALWPWRSWKVPTRQREHVELMVAPVVALYLPVPHEEQAADESNPDPVWNVPAPQSVHTVAADWLAYLPAPHEVHTVSPACVFNVPATHAEHTLCPVVLVKYPALHVTQAAENEVVPAIVP